MYFSFTGQTIDITWTVVFVLVVLAVQIIFTIGLSFFLAMGNLFFRDININAKKHLDNLKGILVCGDIAFAGHEQEYKKAQAFLENITDCLDISNSSVYCVPGNAGMAQIAECHQIDIEDLDALAEFAKAESIDLTIVGPEAPLAEGLEDVFSKYGLRAFGASKSAAQIEASKAYAKNLMSKYV